MKVMIIINHRSELSTLCFFPPQSQYLCAFAAITLVNYYKLQCWTPNCIVIWTQSHKPSTDLLFFLNPELLSREVDNNFQNVFGFSLNWKPK